MALKDRVKGNILGVIALVLGLVITGVDLVFIILEAGKKSLNKGITRRHNLYDEQTVKVEGRTYPTDVQANTWAYRVYIFAPVLFGLVGLWLVVFGALALAGKWRFANADGGSSALELIYLPLGLMSFAYAVIINAHAHVLHIELFSVLLMVITVLPVVYMMIHNLSTSTKTMPNGLALMLFIGSVVFVAYISSVLVAFLYYNNTGGVTKGFGTVFVVLEAVFLVLSGLYMFPATRFASIRTTQLVWMVGLIVVSGLALAYFGSVEFHV